MKHEYPSRLRSKRDRTRFDRVVNDLARHDLDADSRVELIVDFVEIDRRIADLNKDVKGGSIATRLSANRALSIATAERRRLHQRLFAGGKRPDEKLPPVAIEAAGLASNAADEAWRRHFHRREFGLPRLANDGTPEMSQAIAEFYREGEDLERRFGRPSWNAMLYANAEEQIAAERAVQKFRNSRWATKQRRTDDRSEAA
ncbi:hypothetical protein MesoLj131c_47120 [Mesorhizobium sp. 131-3-5]|uniref:hypothetical protein n=1 Tax=Mesorhizobium sp. 131-3-5 TaxID=2744520 RepID=UPI0019283BD8|nr:hypothetical protein [Mesorhizobium sp. 131-3-5]BCH10454.1 hypothetical protein MesoLj131c_47120 [Mesorhizobium sp. 131-3-5]